MDVKRLACFRELPGVHIAQFQVIDRQADIPVNGILQTGWRRIAHHQQVALQACLS